jgi:HAD superfamily hydrolase (TIGR01509 family)
MRRHAGVLLDVDGTLVDSNDAHAHAWAEAFAEAGMDVPYARVRSLIGMGGDKLIATIAGEHAPKNLSERRSEIFRERWLAHVKPLRGARELLLRLESEQYAWILASAAKKDELDGILRVAGLADLCGPERRTTSSEVEASKPDPDVIEVSLRKLGVERSRAVMLGDTPYDVEAARAAGVDLIAFTTGGWSREALAGAVAVYDGPADLLASWDDSPLSTRSA